MRGFITQCLCRRHRLQPTLFDATVELSDKCFIIRNVLIPVPLERRYRVESTTLPLIVNQKVHQLIYSLNADCSHLCQAWTIRFSASWLKFGRSRPYVNLLRTYIICPRSVELSIRPSHLDNIGLMRISRNNFEATIYC